MENGRIIPYPFGFRPTLHKYRFGQYSVPCLRKEGCCILVGAAGDMFGEWVSEEWIRQVLAECCQHPRHIYLFITRSPKRYQELREKGLLPETENFWYGIQADSRAVVDQIEKLELPEQTWLYIDFQTEPWVIPSAAEDKISWLVAGGQNSEKRKNREWAELVQTFTDQNEIAVFIEQTAAILAGKSKQEYPAAYLDYKVKQEKETRYYAACKSCGSKQPKKEMAALFIRAAGETKTKTLGYLCRDCLQLTEERKR